MICPPDCPGRTATCHGDCEYYLNYWAGKRRENAERARQNEADFVAKEAREKALRQRRDAQKRRKRK